MNELEYKNKIVAALSAQGYKVQRHEDKHENFIADLSFSGNYVDGWIEVKYCARVPRSLHAIEHWTKGQEDWLRERGSVGSGHCYLLVGTPKLHVLWHYGLLFRARPQPWTQSIQLAAIMVHGIPALVGDFCRLARVRGG